MSEPTEDITGDIDPFATPEEDESIVGDAEDLTPETVLVREIRKYLDEAEAEHNSFDVIDLAETAKMNPTQQIAVHKLVTKHIRNIRQVINSKVKEN